MDPTETYQQLKGATRRIQALSLKKNKNIYTETFSEELEDTIKEKTSIF